MVDLKGLRVVAQAIVPGGWGRWVGQGVCHEWMRWGEGVSYAPPTPPGLLQSDPTSFIRYGALDNKEEFKMDQEFVKMVRESGGHVSGDAHSDPPVPCASCTV